MSVAVRSLGLLILSAAPAWAQAPAGKKDAPPAPAHWTLLFAYDDPVVWDKDAKNTKGEQVAIPLKFAPEKFRYLRLRRMDTGAALILPLTPDQLRNGKPHDPDAAFWWNGTAQEDGKGRLLGIVEAKRYKSPAPKDLIGVMTEDGDAFTGSGFGHKGSADDGQYYCWRGKEIKRTVFEIAVSDGPLSPEETRSLLAKP